MNESGGNLLVHQRLQPHLIVRMSEYRLALIKRGLRRRVEIDSMCARAQDRLDDERRYPGGVLYDLFGEILRGFLLALRDSARFLGPESSSTSGYHPLTMGRPL
jgi:hypothetical protein